VLEGVLLAFLLHSNKRA